MKIKKIKKFTRSVSNNIGPCREGLRRRARAFSNPLGLGSEAHHKRRRHVKTK